MLQRLILLYTLISIIYPTGNVAAFLLIGYFGQNKMNLLDLAVQTLRFNFIIS